MLEPAIQDKRRWWSREDLIVLVALGILFYLPGLSQIPLFDRDEPRFAVAARTMLETGDYIVPRFNGMLRPDKPPLVYWLMDLAYLGVGRVSELGARLPSAICGMGTLLVVYFMVGARFGRVTGFVSAMMLGSCALYVVESRMATADSTMVLFIVICMACAWQAWDAAGTAGSGERPSHVPRADYLPDRSADRAALVLDQMAPSRPRRMSLGMALLFWVSLAAGTLAKGVPLVFVFVPMIGLSLATGDLAEQLRRWRSHFHLTRRRVGMALAIAAVMTGFLIAAGSAHVFLDYRAWAIVVSVLLMGMVLTPGLPGILVRCLWHGNWRWWRQLRPAIGIPILIVLVGWWVVWAGIATHWQLIWDMVGNHFLNRTGTGALLHWMGVTIPDTTTGGTQDAMKSYARWPGFYTLLVWATFWPWSILLVPGAFHLLRRLRGKTPIAIDPRPYQFLVAWIVPMWILLELARGKLPHYPLPVYVPLAILCADTLVQSWERLTDVLAAAWFGAMRWVTLGIWFALAVALLVAVRMHPDPDMLWRVLPLALCLAITGFVNAYYWGTYWWPWMLAGIWGLTLLSASGWILPQLPDLQVSRVAGARMAERKAENPELHLAVCDYEDATLVFYGGHNLERFDTVKALVEHVPFAPDQNPEQAAYLMVVSDAVLHELEHRHLQFVQVPRIDLPKNLGSDVYRISGINTGNFKRVSVTVITNAAPALTESQAAPAGEAHTAPATQR